MLPMLALVGLRWLTVLAALGNVLAVLAPVPWMPHVSWWWIALGWVLLLSPPGRIATSAAGARLLLRGVRPGDHPRGGPVHLRLWAAERLAELTGATGVAGAGWMITYAKLLGARIGRTSTCTPPRRSPACSSSAAGSRSSPRSTCPATGSTATWCGSARSGSARAAGSAPAAR